MNKKFSGMDVKTVRGGMGPSLQPLMALFVKNKHMIVNTALFNLQFRKGGLLLVSLVLGMNSGPATC